MGHLAWQVLVWGKPVSSLRASQWWPPGTTWRAVWRELRGSFMLFRGFPASIIFHLSRSPWLLVIGALHPARDQLFFFADSLSALPPHSQGLLGTLFSSWRPPLSPILRWDPRTFLPGLFSCFTDCAKDFHCVDHNKLWQIFKEMGMPDHLTCLLRNLYAGQEATVRTGHGTTDWFQIGKGVRQGCILSPYLFNLHAEYIMRNAGLDEAQAAIKFVERNINNLRYTDTLMAESEEELKGLCWRWKRRVKKLA